MRGSWAHQGHVEVKDWGPQKVAWAFYPQITLSFFQLSLPVNFYYSSHSHPSYHHSPQLPLALGHNKMRRMWDYRNIRLTLALQAWSFPCFLTPPFPLVDPATVALIPCKTWHWPLNSYQPVSYHLSRKKHLSTDLQNLTKSSQAVLSRTCDSSTLL